MIKWRTPSYDGDRRVAVSGHIDVGAVFPPLGLEHKWRWRLWVNGKVCATTGQEPTELAAKIALDRAWASFLMLASLTEAA
ncbi:hypothetical protein [Pseudaminobacter salicylatoxidans]|uniref:hypothetical protein n=1 Tax=Pseudaminobacter salicylatoxidans TaxID=93369 RepID=UPI0011B1E57A|nr:hypothetical protein [Pseudaminobacter salicylatoxidans]